MTHDGGIRRYLSWQSGNWAGRGRLTFDMPNWGFGFTNSANAVTQIMYNDYAED